MVSVIENRGQERAAGICATVARLASGKRANKQCRYPTPHAQPKPLVLTQSNSRSRLNMPEIFRSSIPGVCHCGVTAFTDAVCWRR